MNTTWNTQNQKMDKREQHEPQRWWDKNVKFSVNSGPEIRRKVEVGKTDKGLQK